MEWCRWFGYRRSGRGAHERERMARYDRTAAFRSDDPRIRKPRPRMYSSPHEVATSGALTTKAATVQDDGRCPVTQRAEHAGSIIAARAPFHALTDPLQSAILRCAIAKSREASASKLPPATIMQNSVPPLVAPAARSEPQPRIASKPIGIANDARVTPDELKRPPKPRRRPQRNTWNEPAEICRNSWDHATSRPYEFRSVW